MLAEDPAECHPIQSQRHATPGHARPRQATPIQRSRGTAPVGWIPWSRVRGPGPTFFGVCSAYLTWLAPLPLVIVITGRPGIKPGTGHSVARPGPPSCPEYDTIASYHSRRSQPEAMRLVFLKHGAARARKDICEDMPYMPQTDRASFIRLTLNRVGRQSSTFALPGACAYYKPRHATPRHAAGRDLERAVAAAGREGSGKGRGKGQWSGGPGQPTLLVAAQRNGIV